MQNTANDAQTGVDTVLKRESAAMRKLPSRVRKPLTVSASEAANDADWRRATRSQVLWVLLAKLAALMLLWFLFFSPGHRQRVDGEAAGSHFATGGSRAESKETTRD